MKIRSIRHIATALTVLLAGAAVATQSTAATPADFPSKPVRLVVPFPAGGSLDNFTRLLAQQLTEQWKQTVIVDNRPGGAAIIGTGHVAQSQPDGYTLLMMANGFVMVPMLMAKAPYDPYKDFSPITLLARVNQVLVAPTGFAPNSVADLIQAAKAEPGGLRFASFGNGTSSHLGGELLKHLAGINMTHVPYRGVAPAMQDVLGGHVEVFLTNLPETLPYLQNGRLKALGVADNQRAPQLPDVPTFTEQGIREFNVYSWYGVVAPAGTPPAIIERIDTAFQRALQHPDVKSRLTQQGIVPVGEGPENLLRFMRSEQARYAEPIRISGARIE